MLGVLIDIDAPENWRTHIYTPCNIGLLEIFIIEIHSS